MEALALWTRGRRRPQEEAEMAEDSRWLCRPASGTPVSSDGGTVKAGAREVSRCCQRRPQEGARPLPRDRAPWGLADDTPGSPGEERI